METTGRWQLTLGELRVALRAADPAAVLCPPRILRRVIKQHRRVSGPGLHVPHHECYVISRRELLEIAEPAEMGLADASQLAELVVLLIEPEAGALAGMPRARALREYWRLLFHARLHAALAERIERGELTPDTVRERVEALGAVEFDEIRTVLRGEDLQLPPAADLDVYEEFVAFYCELEHFAPALVASCFPSLDDRDAVQRLIAADVDAQAIYRQTTLAGAVENPDDESGEEPALVAERVEPTVAISPRRSEQTYCRVMERADRARARGNLVRSAILRWQATRVVGPKLARAARHEARHDLERLLRRLRAAIELDETTCDTWTDALAALLPPAARGFWTAEARLLYDLQKVCVDH